MAKNDQTAAARSTILAAAPQLFVADIPRATAFYVGQLGFIVAFSYGEPAF